MRFLVLFMLLWAGVVDAREIEPRTYGAPSANTIYIFTSPSCIHCRDFHKNVFPEILKRFVKTGQAQVQVVDIVGSESALQAVKLMRCLPDEKANKMMNWVYENQEQWMADRDYKQVFLQYALALGMNIKDFDSCLSDEALEEAILAQRDSFSRLYRVSGTPTTVLRQGNTVHYYIGADRTEVLQGLEQEIKRFEKQQKENAKDK